MPQSALTPFPEDVAFLEDLMLTGWPALRIVHHDGWLIRMAGGHSGRSNAVTVVGPGRLNLADKIAFAESVYAAHGMPAVFRLTPLAPPELGPTLAERGYRDGEESLVMTAALSGLVATPDPGVRLSRTADDDWCDTYVRIRALPAAQHAPMRAILEATPMPTVYAAVMEDGAVAATAFAVVDRGWAGLYKVATDPARQGRGLGRRVVIAALAAARDLGAGSAYLQVGAANRPALALYARLGFRVAYGYGYRHR